MKKPTYLTTEQALIDTPLPQQTNTYKPVSNEELILLTLNSVNSAGFQISRKQYTSARDGSISNAQYSISNVADSEMQLMIGWQNSYDKSLSLKFAIGTHIFICENGCVSGDFGAFKKKHAGEIQTFAPQHITEYIKQAGETFRQIQKEREIMKTVEITKRISAELIGRMIIEEEFIQSSQLNIIEKEMRHPTFNYGDPNSLWSLYQYTTYALKETHPSLWMTSHIKAHKFFTEAAGIIQAKKEIVVPFAENPNQLSLDFNIY